MIPNLSYDLIVEELFFMKKTYDRIREDIAEKNREVIQFSVPLMWSHTEYASALLALYASTKTKGQNNKKLA